MELLHSHISSTILKGFYTVANALPFGFDKSFYSNALSIELEQLGLQIDKSKQQQVIYKDKIIGQITFDLVVNNVVAIQVLTEKDCIATALIDLAKNYLKMTNFEVVLLLNFGLEAYHKRVFLSNDYKQR